MRSGVDPAVPARIGRPRAARTWLDRHQKPCQVGCPSQDASARGSSTGFSAAARIGGAASRCARGLRGARTGAARSLGARGGFGSRWFAAARGFSAWSAPSAATPVFLRDLALGAMPVLLVLAVGTAFPFPNFMGALLGAPFPIRRSHSPLLAQGTAQSAMW